MAKGKAPAIPDVKPKSVNDLYSEGVQAQINSLPQLFQAFQTYGPQYAQVMAQQFNQIAPQISSQFYAANPNLAPTQALVTQRIQDAANGNIPSDILIPFRENLRAGQAARGQAESPISSDSEALQLGQFAESYKSNIIGESNTLTGINPINAPLTNASPTPLTPGALGLESATASDLLATGQSQNTLDVNTQLYLQAARQAQYNQQLKNQQALLGGVGAVVGGVAGAYAGGPAGAKIGATIGQNAGQGAATFF